MAEPTEPPPVTPADMFQMLQELGRNGQAAYALLVAASLESYLEALLRERFTNLKSKAHEKITLNDRLFGRNGPFGDFSTKIDAAHALDIIDLPTFQDLHNLRRIRNKFAHPEGTPHFGSDDVQPLMRKFHDFTTELDPYACFSFKAHQLSARLMAKRKLSTLGHLVLQKDFPSAR